MDSNKPKDSNGKEDKLRMELLDDKILDHFEAHRIMAEVFWDYVPDKERVKALAQAAERIDYEIKKAK